MNLDLHHIVSLFPVRLIGLLSVCLGMTPAFAAAGTPVRSGGELHNSIYRIEVRNIDAGEYRGDVQVWDLVSDSDGHLYAATGGGLSVWDGIRWSVYPTSDLPIFRCLAYDAQTGRIYAGADNEFGYFVRDSYGGYEYTRLHRNPRSEVPEIFWRIILHDGAGYFQTHEQIYRYDLQSGRIAPVLTEGTVGYIHAVGDEIWFQNGSALCELRPDGAVVKTGIALSDRVVAVHPQDGGYILITERSGIFAWNGEALHPVDRQLNALLARVRLFAADRTSDGRYLLGSVMDGLYVVDDKWQIDRHFGMREGLLHTTVLTVAQTAAGDIWLGLDGGMARIEASGAGTVVTSRWQEIGSVYDVAQYEGTLYAGTNKGLFRYDGDGAFRLIEGTQGQVWRLIRADDALVVCHDAGTFTLSHGVLHRNDDCSVWQLLPWGEGKDRWIGADFRGGFTIYEIQAGRLYPLKKVEGYGGVHSDMGIDRFQNVWVQNRAGDPVRIRLDADDRAVDVRTFSPGGPQGMLYRARLDNDVFFFRGHDVLGYDINCDSLVRNEYYSSMLGVVGDAPTALTQAGDRIFCIYADGVGMLGRQGNRFFDYGRLNMPQGLNMIPSRARRVIPIDGHTIAIGLQNGVYLFDTRMQDEEYRQPRTPRLERVQLHLRDTSEFMELRSADELYAVPQNYGSIEVRLSNLYSHGQVRYSVDDGPWMTASGLPAFRLNDLQSGKHTLRIRNLDPVNPPSEPLELVFDVAYPWYLQWRFIGCMLLAAAGIGLIVRYFFRRGVERQRRTLLREQERLFEQEKKEHDIELLRVELRERERKLINLTMMGIQRNTMLGELRREVEQFPDQEQRRRVLRRIDSYMNDKENHELFEKYFNTIHDGFFTRLLERHPGLTSNEMRICAYIKLNLSTKEMAAYMNISPSSVEIARHRLRRKMKLASEVNLQHYVSAI